MIESRTFDLDPFNAVEEIFHYDEATGNFCIESRQDIEPLVEMSKASWNGVDARAGWKGDWHHVAVLPPVIYYDLQKKGILDDPKALKKWLNDSDNRVFRTRPGRV